MAYTPASIRRARHRLRLTLPAFAALVGVSRTTVVDWESGRQRPGRMASRLLDAAMRSPEVLEAMAKPARNPATNRPMPGLRPGDVGRVVARRETSAQASVSLSALGRTRRIVDPT